jgi:hypothetical protein
MYYEKERAIDPLFRRSVLLIDGPKSTSTYYLAEILRRDHDMRVGDESRFPQDLIQAMIIDNWESAIIHIQTLNIIKELRRMEKQIVAAHEMFPRIIIAEGDSVVNEVHKIHARLRKRGIVMVDKNTGYAERAEKALKSIFEQYPEP